MVGTVRAMVLAGVVAGVLATDRLGAQSFAVTAEMVRGCALSGSTQTSGIDFGTISFGVHPAVVERSVTASALGGGGTAVQVLCTPGMTFQFAVDAGLHAVGSQRRLALEGGTDVVSYDLFADSGHTEALPATGAVAIDVPATGEVSLPVHAVATLTGVGLMPGAYADTLQVTISW